jgi:hypothetical protein
MKCVKLEHSSQVLLQLWVTHLQTAFYIIALPGTSNASGRIVYTVMGHLSFRYANSFFYQYLNRIGKFLIPIFQKATIHEVVRKLPKNLEPDVLELIKTRWPIFTAVQKHAINNTDNGFQPTTIFKTSFQTLYNSFKGGLDAKTEQMASISLGIKVGFEQKYVMHLMTALVTNAWRSFQLLQ